MQLITTTELRTKTAQLVKALQLGEEVSLIHRSRIIGRVKPASDQEKKFDAKNMEKIVNSLNFEPLTDAEVEKRYRQHLMSRYGKSLSRHE